MLSLVHLTAVIPKLKKKTEKQNIYTYDVTKLKETSSISFSYPM